MSNSKCLQILEVSKVYLNLFFNSTSLYFHTDISTFILNILLSLNIVLSVIDTQSSQYQKVALNSNRL